MADELNVPKSAIQIKSGSTSRHKLVSIDAPLEALNAWFDTLAQ
ncbi:MAG: DUF167 domain-containing protein [Coriobacteriia bacterium]|nr:DUF167 domain-containing protein [Coriobacteriia bacterium]MCL2750631.1 DUF167 domain-containing protein [Coriobacteriia bacterium]